MANWKTLIFVNSFQPDRSQCKMVATFECKKDSLLYERHFLLMNYENFFVCFKIVIFWQYFYNDDDYKWFVRLNWRIWLNKQTKRFEKSRAQSLKCECFPSNTSRWMCEWVSEWVNCPEYPCKSDRHRGRENAYIFSIYMYTPT